MPEMTCNQIGIVEILRDQTYPLDPMVGSAGTTGIVPPGRYPLFRRGEMRFWMMSGRLNFGDIRIEGDGLFIAHPYDISSPFAVKFPSRPFTPRAWKMLLAEPRFTEGHAEQRLRVTLFKKPRPIDA